MSTASGFSMATNDDLVTMQAQIDEEKLAISLAKDMEESERNRLMAEADSRRKELDAERAARDALVAKIQQLSAKLLSGDDKLLDQNRDQETELARKQQELEARLRAERSLRQELEKQEEASLQIEEHFSSLQDEALAKTRKLKKLWKLLVDHRAEYQDLQREQARERSDLLEAVSDLTKELQLALLITEQLLPAALLDLIEAKAIWDDNAERWRMTNAHLAGNNLARRIESEYTGACDMAAAREASGVGITPFLSYEALGLSVGRSHAMFTGDGSSRSTRAGDNSATYPSREHTGLSSGGSSNYQYGNTPGSTASSNRGLSTVAAAAGQRVRQNGAGAAVSMTPRQSPRAFGSGTSLTSSSTTSGVPAGRKVPRARGLVSETRHYA
ncbi:hypothetical protein CAUPRSCDRAFT_11050 [Caulochytrium protostelioides]|uniref:Uncharacterized protein n=1 Tax=Caulochytrium protostelioides TaxID=1555241 RepID=A0A4V1ITJ4_9FUNG|nr:hypothetical protein CAUPRSCDRAFT_11050 [Caulochytrium protostelioides]